MAAQVSELEIRPGGAADVPAVLAILDRAAEWLVAQGRTGQWGTGRQSTNPHRLAQAQTWTRECRLYLAVAGDTPAGALVVADAPQHRHLAADEPELYVRLLVSDPAWKGSGVGARLLDHARALARAEGAGLIRVDCYAGGDGKLVRYYAGQGFKVVRLFDGRDAARRPWTGALLELRLDRAEPA